MDCTLIQIGFHAKPVMLAYCAGIGKHMRRPDRRHSECKARKRSLLLHHLFLSGLKNNRKQSCVCAWIVLFSPGMQFRLFSHRTYGYLMEIGWSIIYSHIQPMDT